jgi:AcrR family transcriptional regulator
MTPRKPSDPAGEPGRPEQRAALLAGAVDHVLEHGMTRLSLRPLAAALGTSDRMLLYYFGTRDGLVVALLTEIGERLRGHLTAAPTDPGSPADVLEQVWAAASAPDAEPYLRLYLEVTSLAARGEEPYRGLAGGLAEGWLEWFESRLDLPPGPARREAATGVLAVLDGLLLLRHAVSTEAAATAAGWFAGALRPPGPPAPATGAAAPRAPRPG